MHNLTGALLLLTCLTVAAGSTRADIGPATEDAKTQATRWSRFVTAATSTAATPVATNAVKYRTGRPEKQVELKRLELPAMSSLRLLTHANIPLKVLMACIPKTRDEVQEMIHVVKRVNEDEKLPQDERIKLHLVCDKDSSFRQIDISQEDFDRYVEVDRYFATSGGDIWMQDWGEIAMVSTPTEKKEQLFILDTNRARSTLAELPGTLARMWNGFYYQKPTPSRTSSGDYGGNIEVTPDGILIVGSTASAELQGILAKGYAGRTAVLDTSWLQVGHVDEFVTTIPSPTAPRGYVIVKADPQLGLDRIAKLSRGELDAEMTELVRTLVKSSAVRDGSSYDKEHTASQRVFALLYAYHAHANGYALDLAQIAPGAGSEAGEVARLIADNARIKATIDAQVEVLKNSIRKGTGDESTGITVVSLPALFEPFGASGKSVALLPGVANLLVLRNHVVVPDPLLPSLRQDIDRGLTLVGLKVHFIPDASYHYFQGQLHCGTNVLRHPNRWVLDPARRPVRAQQFRELAR